MNHCDKSALKSWEISGALLNSGDYKGNVVPLSLPLSLSLCWQGPSLSVLVHSLILVILLSYIINPLKFKYHNQCEA